MNDPAPRLRQAGPGRFKGSAVVANAIGDISGKEEEGLILPVIVAICAGTAVLLRFASLPGPVLPGLTPFFVAGVLATALATSFLLFSWVRDARTWPLLLLGAAYLYSAIVLLLYLLAFPGAVRPGSSLIGGAQSSSWLFVLWTLGFGALTFAAVFWQALGQPVRINDAWVERVVFVAAGLVVVLAGIEAAMALGGGDLLPALVGAKGFTPLGQAIALMAAALNGAGALISLVFLRRDHAVFQWLAVSLVTLCCANLLTNFGGARYTLGWSLSRLSWLGSALAMFIFFIRQFVRRQHLLSNARLLLERSVEQRTADLSQALRQRDLLLREVYHRVKNNLQVVDSLIAMESRRITDPQMRDSLANLRNRVFALGLVHQQLMSSSDLERFSLAPFLKELCDSVSASLATEKQGIAVTVEAAPVMINLDFAIPVGLLATELLSNAVRHAHPRTVKVSFLRSAPGTGVLAVEDDGQGASDLGSRLLESGGTGSRIIQGLTRQLDGLLRVEERQGLRVSIRMPLPDAA